MPHQIIVFADSTLGLTVTTEEIYNAFLHQETAKAFLHGHSFTGNPIACAAANASLDLFEIGYTWKRVKYISEKHASFKSEIGNHPKIKAIRSFGTILALELNTEQESSYFSEKRDFIYRFFLDRGILLRPLGNIAFVNPPYCITEEELTQVYNSFNELLEIL